MQSKEDMWAGRVETLHKPPDIILRYECLKVWVTLKACLQYHSNKKFSEQERKLASNPGPHHFDPSARPSWRGPGFEARAQAYELVAGQVWTLQLISLWSYGENWERHSARPTSFQQEHEQPEGADRLTFRSQRRSGELFSNGRACAPYKWTWAAAGALGRHAVGDWRKSTTDDRQRLMTAFTRNRPWLPLQLRLCSWWLFSVRDDGQNGDGQHGGNRQEGCQKDIRGAEWSCRTVLVEYGESFRFMKRQCGRSQEVLQIQAQRWQGWLTHRHKPAEWLAFVQSCRFLTVSISKAHPKLEFWSTHTDPHAHTHTHTDAFAHRRRHAYTQGAYDVTNFATEDVNIRREIRSTAAAGESPGVSQDKLEQLGEMYDRWIWWPRSGGVACSGICAFLEPPLLHWLELSLSQKISLSLSLSISLSLSRACDIVAGSSPNDQDITQMLCKAASVLGKRTCESGWWTHYWVWMPQFVP